MNHDQALAFVRTHGIVLASAKGPVPRLTDTIVGEPVRGSWWAHPKGKEIFRILQGLSESEDILVCRLCGGKVTYVHRRLWPALVRAAAHFTPEQLAKVREEHTVSGKHVTHEIAFPGWVSVETRMEASKLTESEALEQLGGGAGA